MERSRQESQGWMTAGWRDGGVEAINVASVERRGPSSILERTDQRRTGSTGTQRRSRKSESLAVCPSRRSNQAEESKRQENQAKSPVGIQQEEQDISGEASMAAEGRRGRVKYRGRGAIRHR